jgi:hypothetical protein
MCVDVPTRNVQEDIEALFEDPKALIEYLEGMVDGGMAGVRCNSFACPVAIFVKKALDYYAVEVTGRDVVAWPTAPSTSIPGSIYEMPVWVKAFISDIDGRNTRRESVSKHEAINTLYKILYYMDEGYNLHGA